MFSKFLPLAALAFLAVTGCSLEKSGTGGNQDVSIKTPLGGMKVKTNDAAVIADIGLPAYPGATEVKKKNKNNGAADVDMNFGDFHLRVKAVAYQTPDSPESVIAFYRKRLATYGDVIECKDKRPVGTPSKTSEGLTCDDSNNHFMISDTPGHVELKAGGKTHQHIVAVEKHFDGTKIGLVALNLPAGKSESN